MILIHGIEEKQGFENTDEAAIEVFNKAKVTVEKKSINRSHRIGKRNNDKKRPIIVSFCSYQDKKAVFDAKKNLKGSKIVITESLTKSRYTLLQQCWETYGKNRCWTYDGRIWVEVDGDKFVISNEEDLAEIRTDQA